ncbi:hypothetical protein KAT08_00340 [Candidatus Babeliales bacterium]|nr:hypothetical protein [Candidatus Babeliales bacterium]
MKFRDFKSFIFSLCFLLQFIFFGFFPLNGKEINIQKGKEALENDLGFLFDNVLDQDFLKSEDKELALKLRIEFDGKYDLIDLQSNSLKKSKNVGKKIRILRLLVKSERIAISKLEVLLAASSCKNYGYFLSLQEWRIVKLKILKKLYNFLQDSWKSILNNKIDLKDFEKKLIDNEFITKCVTEQLSGKICGELYKLVEFDFYNLCKSLYKKYENFINKYRELKIGMIEIDDNVVSELDNLLNDFCKQKSILDDKDFGEAIKSGLYSWFWFVGGENQIKKSEKIFELFINNLIKIKNEIYNFNDVFSRIYSINDNKKRDILIGHLVVTNKQEFQDFGNYKEFSNYFEEYRAVVDTYVNSEKELDEKFIYRIRVLLSKLHNLKNSIESYSFLNLIIGIAKSKKVIKSLVTDMIEILNHILSYVGNSNDDIKNGSSFIERLLSGDVVISEKIQKWIWKFVNSTVN